MFFIAAPFGNYLKSNRPAGWDILSVSGTWTLRPRPGRLKQVLKTLRYTKDGWVNKLGLKNQGIEYGLKNPRDVMSISAIEMSDWHELYRKIPKQANVEINLGCPNTTPNVWPGFASFTRSPRRWCIAKIPPTFTNNEIDFLVDSGFKQIHASNTLPVPQGGLSGKKIMPYTLRILKYIKKVHPHVEVIAGGGITTIDDVRGYRDYGADHFSLGTVCFTPWKISKIINMVDLKNEK